MKNEKDTSAAEYPPFEGVEEPQIRYGVMFRNQGARNIRGFQGQFLVFLPGKPLGDFLRGGVVFSFEQALTSLAYLKMFGLIELHQELYLRAQARMLPMFTAYHPFAPILEQGVKTLNEVFEGSLKEAMIAWPKRGR